MLPQSGIRSNAVLTVVNQDVHGVAVHGRAHQHVVVVVVGEDLLDGIGGTGLELLDGLLAGTLLLELVVEVLDVSWNTVSQSVKYTHALGTYSSGEP